MHQDVIKKIEVLDGLKYYVHIWKSPSNSVSISSYIWILFVNQSHALVDSVIIHEYYRVQTPKHVSYLLTSTN